MSLMRAISVPLGIKDPDRPNIASTLWRTVSDTKEKRYFFESALSPSVFWVDLGKLDLSASGKTMKLDLQAHPILSGEVSASFAPAEPFRFIAPAN
jgi:choloylglycine hydrolase